MHHLVHNESCTCHIAGVLHKGDAKIQDKDIGQEHYNAADTADAMSLLWMSVGTDDFLYPEVVRNKKYFDDKGIKATYIERPEQHHTWMHARYCLAELLKSLFVSERKKVE